MGSRALSNFSTEIRNRGIAKSAKFYIELGIPQFMNFGLAQDEFNLSANDEVNLVTLLAESVQFPEFVLATAQIRDDGNGREFVYDKMYPAIVCSFICDADMIVKRFFDKWAQGALKTVTGSYRYQDQYVLPEIKIYQLNEKHEEVYCVTLYDVFPKLVNDLSSSASSRDYHRCQVQFSYRHWTSNRTSSVITAKPNSIEEQVAYAKKFGYASLPEDVKRVLDQISVFV